MFIMQIDLVDAYAPILEPECKGKTGNISY